MPDSEHLADWRRMHDLLLAKERALVDCATKLAAGECSEEEANSLQDEVIALRLLADAIFERAFGGVRPPAAS